jgi:hypothetical protein
MKTSPLLLSLLMVSACKVEKQIDTFEKRTSNLEKTTNGLSYTTEDIKKIADAIYPQIRTGDGIRVRNEAWSILTNERKGLGEKMVAGGVYFQALEYQFWTAHNSDNENVLHLMYRDAADEFQGRIYDLYLKVDLKEMSPLKTGKRNNEETAFYALAMTMDRSHHFQQELQKKYPDLSFMTFMDIVKKCLTKDKSGLPVELHEEILLSGINKEIILELYKARIDVLSALALRDLVDQRNMTIGHFSKAAIFLVTQGRLGSLEIPETYDGVNVHTKNNVIKYLDRALEAKSFLESIGINHKMEKMLRSAYNSIDFNQGTGDRTKDPTREQIRTRIKALLN